LERSESVPSDNKMGKMSCEKRLSLAPQSRNSENDLASQMNGFHFFQHLLICTKKTRKIT